MILLTTGRATWPYPAGATAEGTEKLQAYPHIVLSMTAIFRLADWVEIHGKRNRQKFKQSLSHSKWECKSPINRHKRTKNMDKKESGL
jgi:hypothetical protein